MNLTLIRYHMGCHHGGQESWGLEHAWKWYACQILWRESKGIHRVPHFIKLDYSDIEYNDVDWIHLDWNRDQWQSLVNKAINLWVT